MRCGGDVRRIGVPATSAPGVFFFHRVCMRRFFLPVGEKVVTAP
jgi:hypothetical protein